MRVLLLTVLWALGCGGGAVGDMGVDLGVAETGQPPLTCLDGAKNGEETDVDCGGTCFPCQDARLCMRGKDCYSGACENGKCAAPTCNDGVKNGVESDTDCGGGICPKCATGKMCVAAGDCESGSCLNNICRSSVCGDGNKNGDETDVDCGGTACGQCPDGKTCNGGSDCMSGRCVNGTCRRTEDMGGISDLGVKPPDLSFVPDLRSMTGRASWEDPETGRCDGRIWQTMAKIRDALPVGPTTVTISATQVAPRPNYGSWSGVFPKTTCVRAWLSVWAARDGLAFDNWNPGVCQAMDDKGKAYHFIYNAQSQAAIYPVGANPGQYMGVYLLDRTDAKCDLVGVGNRPGFDAQETNTAVFGTKGDRLSFSW